MGRNASGVYSLPAGSIVADGEDILASQHNNPINDIAADLNAARPIVAGGTGASTAAEARAALGVGSSVQYVSNMAAMKALTVSNLSDGAVLELIEYRDGSGVGGGTFVYDAGSSATADAGMVIAPLVGSGRFLRQTDRITPQVFGSLGAMKVIAPVAPYLLSDYYASLALAQADYPKATALTQTIDDMACQAMVDHVRANIYFARGNQEISRNHANNGGLVVRMIFPRGVYYLTRPLDLTGIETRDSVWELSAESAVILGATTDKPIMDFTGARRCNFSGTAEIVGIWVAAGVPLCGIKLGRAGDGTSADTHVFTGAWQIKGRYSLGALYNYASEDVRYGVTSAKNDLDNRVYHITFSDSDAVKTFGNLETVTWDAGASTGIAKYITFDTVSGGVAIRLVSGSAPTAGDTITGVTSTKVATVDSAIQEPAGVGPDGRSYVMVQDGDNYWAVGSDYQDDAAADTPASFLRNTGTIDIRHTGRGDAMWCSAGRNHNWQDSYIVADDPDGGAGVVGFANTETNVLTGFLFDVHVETDGADTDGSTGLDYGVKFEAADPGTAISCIMFEWRRNTVHPQTAMFFAGTNVASVNFSLCKIVVQRISRDVGQVMFSNPALFTFNGILSCPENGTGPFFNVSSLAGVTGTVTCGSVASSNVKHPTSKYILQDVIGGMVLHNGSEVSGPITGAAVTSSDLDAVSTKLMRPGNFGLGKINAGGVLADFDATDTPTGFYRYINTTTNVASKPADFSGFGYMLVERYDGDGIKQTIMDAVGDVKIAIRNSVDGVFGPWATHYTTENLVGTVSESAGVPTGAAFEFGSTASGYYQKTADGMLKCWGRLTTSTTAEVSVIYPVPFASAGDISVSLTPFSTAEFGIAPKMSANSTTGFSAAAWRTNTSTRIAALVFYTTTGRWY